MAAPPPVTWRRGTALWSILNSQNCFTDASSSGLKVRAPGAPVDGGLVLVLRACSYLSTYVRPAACSGRRKGRSCRIAAKGQRNYWPAQRDLDAADPHRYSVLWPNSSAEVHVINVPIHVEPWPSSSLVELWRFSWGDRLATTPDQMASFSRLFNVHWYS